jgi:hypothetical protein
MTGAPSFLSLRSLLAINADLSPPSALRRTAQSGLGLERGDPIIGGFEPPLQVAEEFFVTFGADVDPSRLGFDI